MRKTTALLDPIPAAVLTLVVLAATAQPPAPQRTDASRFREPDPIAFGRSRWFRIHIRWPNAEEGRRPCHLVR